MSTTCRWILQTGSSRLNTSESEKNQIFNVAAHFQVNICMRMSSTLLWTGIGLGDVGKWTKTGFKINLRFKIKITLKKLFKNIIKTWLWSGIGKLFFVLKTGRVLQKIIHLCYTIRNWNTYNLAWTPAAEQNFVPDPLAWTSRDKPVMTIAQYSAIKYCTLFNCLQRVVWAFHFKQVKVFRKVIS